MGLSSFQIQLFFSSEESGLNFPVACIANNLAEVISFLDLRISLCHVWYFLGPNLRFHPPCHRWVCKAARGVGVRFGVKSFFAESTTGVRACLFLRRLSLFLGMMMFEFLAVKLSVNTRICRV